MVAKGMLNDLNVEISIVKNKNMSLIFNTAPYFVLHAGWTGTETSK
jgi:hypothetical protein